jgi:hypothetical protein
MPKQRKIEIFSAGCPVCRETVARIRDAACTSCDIVELDMADPPVAQRALSLGALSVPAVAIDGRLADCCAGRGPVIETLKQAGLGRPLP